MLSRVRIGKCTDIPFKGPVKNAYVLHFAHTAAFPVAVPKIFTDVST